MLASVLLAAIVDANAVCARFRNDYAVPDAAVAAYHLCKDEGLGCDLQLAERFANGKGVKRSYEIAEYFLCEAEPEMVPAEFDGMFEHVEKMRAGTTKKPLRFCDHTTSGYSESFCAHMRWEVEIPELDARIAAVRKSSSVKPQFDAMRKRAAAYLESESKRRSELFRGGTGYSAAVLLSDIDTKAELVKELERWSKERAPAAKIENASAADAELNAAYRAAQKGVDREEEEVADWKTLLRDAQRAWIAYRDAFAAFYVERWKGSASPEALRRDVVTQLTRARAAELRKDS